MRAALTLGRTYLRQSLPRARPILQCRGIQNATKRTYGSGGWRYFRPPPRRDGLILTAAAALSPVAFVQLSEKDNGGTKQTAEGRMLEASRDEIKKEVREDVRGIWRLRDSIVLFLDVYLWEPLCTGTRFLHLVVIFVPVIATVPMIWIGRRNKERDDERSGTLWWYWFLVKSMERAGPAFIKVAPPLPVPRLSSLFPAWTMGSFANRYLPNPDV
jgi:aarF domain-containing kinase